VRVERQTLAEAVYERLRGEIVTGTLQDGEELNSVALADRFGVSRVPVREALQRLMAESLVSGDPYRRVVVATVGRQEVAELLAIREELEVFGLHRRLANASAPALTHARSLNEVFRTVEDGEHRIELDRQIHAAFMVGSPAAAKIVDDIRTRTQRYVGAVRGGASRREAAHHEHEQLLEALEAGDAAKAESLLREHIGSTRRLLTAEGELALTGGGA
jgi:DNA-binding GntR family transcriptional regulator